MTGLRLCRGVRVSAGHLGETGFWRQERGWAASAHYTPDGRRVLVELVLPGELVEFQHLLLDAALQYATLTETRLCPVSSEISRQEMDHLSRSRLVRRVVGLQTRSARDRLLDFLGDIYQRLNRHRKTEESFPLPLTQSDLGDLVGISSVHVSRCLTRLRAAGCIDARGGSVQLLRSDAWNELAARNALDDSGQNSTISTEESTRRVA